MQKREPISSRDNAGIKAARAVREGRDHELVFLEGVRLVGEALRSPVRFRTCFVTSEMAAEAEREDLLNQIAGRCEVIECTDAVFRTIADTKTPQGIALITERPAEAPLDDILRDAKSALILYLHEISDPSNLGAVLRTSEAADVAAVCISPNSADPMSARSLRASMGAALRLPVATDVESGNLISKARESNFAVFAASGAGAVDHTSVDWGRNAVLAIGSEADGLPGDILREADAAVRIPMANAVESLNLAVSTGILLFERFRQVNRS